MLNSLLYRKLKGAFGEVKIWNENVPLLVNYVFEANTGKKRLQIIQRGETYAVNCPFCIKYCGRPDTKFRLNINHRWGTSILYKGVAEWNLAICFNENCLIKDKKNLENLKLLLGKTKCSPLYNQEELSNNEEELKSISLPEGLIPINSLPDDHPAVSYLVNRNFDVDFLFRSFSVYFCSEFNTKYKLAYNRIIVPILFKNKCVGWQGRIIGDSIGYGPKYYTSPKTPLGRILYNYDRISEGKEPVLVVEGVTDVWRFPNLAVATFGSKISFGQIKLLKELSRPVFIFWDADATEKAYKYRDQLAKYLDVKVLECPKKDPADLILV